MRSRLVFFAYPCVVSFLLLLMACGGTGSNNNQSSNNNASPGSTTGPGSPGSSGSGSGGSSGSGSGTGSSSSFVSYAYTASTSAIRGYGVKTDGSLTPLTGSPFAASTGVGANIVTNGANLYAIAGDFKNLNIFSIDKSSGALTLANTTSALTGDPHAGNSGDSPASLALDHTGTSLYVTIGFSDFDSGINLFTVGNSPNAQQVQFLEGPAIALPPPIFSSNNQFAYSSTCGIRIDGVFGYARASDGTLSHINPGLTPGPKEPGEAFCPASIVASAKGYAAILWPHFDFASSAPGNETFVMTYTINADGTLTAISNSQVQTASTKANRVVMNFDPTGSLLAVAGDGGVQIYALNSNGTLAPIGSPQAAGVTFQNVAWDKSNHVFATTSSQLYVFSSNSGTLTPVSGSPYAGDSGLAVLPLQ